MHHILPALPQTAGRRGGAVMNRARLLLALAALALSSLCLGCTKDSDRKSAGPPEKVTLALASHPVFLQHDQL